MKIDKYFHLWADKSTVHFDEVEPVECKQKGEWDYNLVCSICGSQIVDIAFKDKAVNECMNYCPCCGSYMRGEE